MKAKKNVVAGELYLADEQLLKRKTTYKATFIAKYYRILSYKTAKTVIKRTIKYWQKTFT
jgi:hypothetical protein